MAKVSSILDDAGVQMCIWLLFQLIRNIDYLWADKFQRLMIVSVNVLTLLLSNLRKWNWFIWNHIRALSIVFWRVYKMFVKDQDCVSHTLEVTDKVLWYNGQPLFQVCNREFFRAVEDAWNYRTSIKVSSTTHKTNARQGSILEFFSPWYS